jgi:hypothetical protein
MIETLCLVSVGVFCSLLMGAMLGYYYRTVEEEREQYLEIDQIRNKNKKKEKQNE